MTRMSPHYSFHADTWPLSGLVPKVVVSEEGVVVKVVRGVTFQHAIARAVKWAQANGDPR